MSYTLAKWALWLIGAAAIGFVVGWLLRGLRGGAAAAADEPMETSEEVEALRARVASLEPLINEREKLRIQLEDCRQSVAEATAGAVAGAHAPLPTRQPVSSAGLAALAADSSVVADRDRLAALVGSQEATIGDLRARLWNQDTRLGELHAQLAAHFADTSPPPPDLEEGARVLGEKVRFNDLTVVEGIGPKIADVLQAAGIKTWWQLHQTDVLVIADALAAAGPRFQVHDPATWPQQGGLLARGEWQTFKTLTDQLRGGKLSG